MAGILAWSRWYFSGAFIACAYLSFSYIMGNGFRSGYFDLFPTFERDGVPVLPGCLEPAETHFTGITALDRGLVDMLRFFWSCTSGDYAPLSIFSIWMAGQVIAFNTVMAVEGVRAGNSGTLIAYPYLWQQIYQIITWGFTMSNYWHFHFLQSPISHASAPGGKIPSLDLLLPTIPTDILVIPLSLTLGYVLPTTLAGMPGFSRAHKQQLLAIWQIFPIYTGVAQFVLSRIARQWRATNRLVPAATARRWMRFTYAYGMILTSVVHLVVILVVISRRAQALLLPESQQGLVTARSVFGTSFRFGPPPPVTTFEQGTLDLLLMDTYWACAASFLWLAIINGGLSVATMLRLTLGFLVAGPTGSVLAWTWWRDERAFKLAEESGKIDKTD